jgi:predicted transcriptional regulator
MVIIEDKSLTGIILNAFGDPKKLSILKTILGKPMIISEILNKCKISSTSGYRKINSLIQCGLLVKNDLIMTRDNKKVIRYKSLFENFEVHIEKGKVTVKAQFTS